MPKLSSTLTHFAISCIIALTPVTGYLQTETTPYNRSLSTSATQYLLPVSNSSRTKESVLRSEFKPLSLLDESLWQRLSNGFQFVEIDNSRVDEQLKFLQKGLKSMRSNLYDARPYLFHIANQLDRASVPLDIAVLPLIESAFNPTALSSKSAAGIWQFIPATAIHYGLSVGKNHDQRKDVFAATTAAVRYLTDLHRLFEGDWLLALAAYNTGPGNVRSAMNAAIKRGEQPTYWNLRLSKETSNYVPRLIAATKIISDPEAFGMQLPPLANRKKIESVSVGRRISVQQVANLTDLSVEEVTKLNPSLGRGLTPVDGPHKIIIPSDTTPVLFKELARLKRKPLIDTGSQIAVVSRNNTNPFNVDSQIHKTANHTADESYTPYRTYQYKTHTVVPGDTLTKVSQLLNVDIPTLRRWNDLESDALIKVGDTLGVALISNQISDEDSAALMHYRARVTDSLQSIADKFDLEITEIRKWNDSLLNEDHIQAGQIIRIPTNPIANIANTRP